ncbi:hypothetical protein [Mangrovicoccus ximenensis]|uniref:hypothetical protein n=1 Tax=Mangrovicoccus ximenensis TaxID=1911570 RepID=UPI0011AE9AC9|nr:hypothetical protein [Mangrovicoccus ximenensis]
MTRRMHGMAAVLALLAAPAAAAEPSAMSGEEFGAYVDGHTVTYAHDGRVYGMEQYLPGRKVIWRQFGGDCQEGVWFEAGGQICFDYGEGIPLQCWQFVHDGGRLGARADSDPAGSWLYEVQRSTEPMHCPAPYLGT